MPRLPLTSVLCVSLILGMAVIPLQAQSDRFTPKDLFELEIAADPQISPDGQWVVYVRQYSDIMSDTRYSNLWLIGVDGAGHRPLTTGHYNDNTPRWSPDGTELFYGRPPGSLYAVSVDDSSGSFRSGRPEIVFDDLSPGRGSYDVFDSNRFLLIERVGDDSAPAGVTVVVNWFEELEARVPTGR